MNNLEFQAMIYVYVWLQGNEAINTNLTRFVVDIRALLDKKKIG